MRETLVVICALGLAVGLTKIIIDVTTNGFPLLRFWKTTVHHAKLVRHLPRNLRLLDAYLFHHAGMGGGMIGRYGFFFNYTASWRQFLLRWLCKIHWNLHVLPLPPMKKIEYRPTNIREYMRKQVGFPECYAGHDCGGIQFCARGKHHILRGEQCRICSPHKQNDVLNTIFRQREKLLKEIREEIALIRWINCFPDHYWMYHGVMDCWKRSKSGELIYCGPAFFVTNFGPKRFVWSELEKKIPISKVH